MNILAIQELEIPEIKIIRFAKFNDERGYLTEIYNENDFEKYCDFLKNYKFKQVNETFSLKNTFRGLHFQFKPPMGKLVRLIYGKLFDFALDLRPHSHTYKHIVAYEVQSTCEFSEWIWLPPGFAHGAWLLENSMIEYFCTETYNPVSEQTISIFSEDINWTKCNPKIITEFSKIDKTTLKIKERDLQAMSIFDWEKVFWKHRTEPLVYGTVFEI